MPKALPWKPFHPIPLADPAAELTGLTEAVPMRAVMQLIEAEITGEANAITADPGAPIRFQCLRDLHDRLTAAVHNGA